MASESHVVNDNPKKNNQKYRHRSKKDAVKRWDSKKKKKPNEVAVIKRLQDSYQSIDTSTVKSFTDLPLSDKTQQGLREHDFKEPTEIQRESLRFSLQGLDILGAAKTGSGKTLAFLIPVLERLYVQQWTGLDGLGALIITPTRELAFQIFETLRKVGKHHEFSAGLIIGGKDLKFESKRMDRCNIVIGTPGRILQHMDENPLFDCSSMQIVVLDEADRCLDLGFEKTMNSIIENLPPERQTLLFSATQTKSVRDLARLSLHDPMYVSVHEHSKHSTPEGLRQSYIVCDLQDKLPMLWSFLRNHKRKKTLVFLSSCKQVKYVYEMMCKLKPGVSLMALYGTLHQMRRMSIYENFCTKKHAVLFATDIAARGLDFPAVDWVLQLDCPEDAATYVHRAGRTARYNLGGESLLVLLPSEVEAMVEALTKQRVPIEKIKINPRKLQNPQLKMEALLARDPELKASAQRALVSYVKAVFLMKDKNVFDVQALDLEAFARSLGLAMAPRVRFLQRHMKKTTKVKAEPVQDNSDAEEEDSSDKSEESSESEVEDKKVKSKPANLQSYQFTTGESDEEEDSMLTMKRRNHDLEAGSDIEEPMEQTSQEKSRDAGSSKKIITKASLAKKILKKNIKANKKTVFDEEGEVVRDATKEKVSEAARQYEETEGELGGIDIDQAKIAMKEEDRVDKQRYRERLKAKKREAKLKLKQQRQGERERREQEEEAEDSDSEGPDLSWLPDPDKIYGKEGDAKSDSESAPESERESEDSEDSESEVHKPKRQKLATIKESRKPKAPLKDTGFSLKEDEELALQFLRVLEMVERRGHELTLHNKPATYGLLSPISPAWLTASAA
ncbi:hypothetical protein B566_EDAN010597 [Ephemera danica]|nr:hypothetical protein B566_EDAN010597 [Ephemera danica]